MTITATNNTTAKSWTEKYGGGRKKDNKIQKDFLSRALQP
jgi:hypothetical protein